eukprot:16644-Heterococcus_DN1.PRE.1
MTDTKYSAGGDCSDSTIADNSGSTAESLSFCSILHIVHTRLQPTECVHSTYNNNQVYTNGIEVYY